MANLARPVSLSTFGPGWADGTVAPPEPPEPPIITGNASPLSGPPTGGTTVMLPGTGFLGATGMSFDGVRASEFLVVSANQMRAETPPYAGAGNPPVGVVVIVHHPAGDASRANTFFYMPGEAEEPTEPEEPEPEPEEPTEPEEEP